MSSLKLDPERFNYPPEVYDSKQRHGRLHPTLTNLIWVQKKDGTVDYKLKSRRGSLDPDVERPSLYLGATPEEAITQWMKMSGKIDDGENVIPSNLRTFDHAWEALDERLQAQMALPSGTDGHKRASTYTKHELNYRLHIKPVFGKTPVSKVTTEDWANFWLRLKVTNPNTRLTIKSTINLLYKRAIRKGWTFANTHYQLEPDERPQKPPKGASKSRIIRTEQTLAMISNCNSIYTTMLVVLACTGLRISELCGLRWSDIDWENGVLWVNGQIAREPLSPEVLAELKANPKMKKPTRPLIYDPVAKTSTSYRKVVLLPLTMKALRAQRAKEWEKGFGKESDFVWTASEGPREKGMTIGERSGRPINPDNFRPRGVQAAATKAGLGHVNPHDLRHTTASMFAEAGISVPAAAKMMGHTEKTYIDVYLHAHEDEQEFQTIRTKFAAIAFGDDVEAVAL